MHDDRRLEGKALLVVAFGGTETDEIITRTPHAHMLAMTILVAFLFASERGLVDREGAEGGRASRDGGVRRTTHPRADRNVLQAG